MATQRIQFTIGDRVQFINAPHNHVYVVTSVVDGLCEDPIYMLGDPERPFISQQDFPQSELMKAVEVQQIKVERTDEFETEISYMLSGGLTTIRVHLLTSRSDTKENRAQILYPSLLDCTAADARILAEMMLVAARVAEEMVK